MMPEVASGDAVLPCLGISNVLKFFLEQEPLSSQSNEWLCASCKILTQADLASLEMCLLW